MKFRNTASWHDLGLIILVVLAFLLGGSPRADEMQVAPLRFASFVLLALAIATLPAANWRANRALIACALAWAGLTAAHLIPLPPGVWHALPGRELAVEIGEASGLSDIWRPLSMVPWRTINALFSLALPLAALLFALRARTATFSTLTYILLAMVWLSATVGLLQIIGGGSTPFYFYDVTNKGSGVGLFANRNHHAMFIAMGFPLIAAALSLLPVEAERIRLREWLGIGVGVMLVPFLLMTQSRAGVVLGLLAMGLAWWVYQAPSETSQKRRTTPVLKPQVALAALAVAGIVALTVVFTAANSVQRLGQKDDELRLQVWPPIIRMVQEYVWTGSGMGTFVELYYVHERDDLLSPRYLNHAHNDWLEILLEGGLPFALLLAAALIVVFTRGRALMAAAKTARERAVRRLGASIIAVIALGSLYDYPARTPALAVVLALAIAMVAGTRSNFPADERRQSPVGSR